MSMVGLCRWCRITVTGPDGTALACYVLQGPDGPCLATVDTLCRMTVAARRTGGDVIVDQLSPALRDLLELTGLGAELHTAG
jgi:hypothetical protein